MLRQTLMFLLLGFASLATAQEAIPIADLKRDKPVDFATEVLPLFQKSCLACHNASDAKGDLVLETPDTIRKGGESGAAVLPGKPDESLLLKVSAHQTKPIMPPKNNRADARPLKSDELGLLKLWIQQGATGVVNSLPPIRWQQLAETFNPVLASAISPDGLHAACARGNQIDLYSIPTLQYIGSLTSPDLPAADRDVVESLAFSPDGQLLASGGYRNVKLWRLQPPAVGTNIPSPSKLTSVITNKEIQILEGDKEIRRIAAAANATAISPDNKRLAAVDGALVRLINLDDGKTLVEFKGDTREQLAVELDQRALNFAKSETAFRKANVEAAEKTQKTEAEALKKATDSKNAAEKSLAEKNEAAKKASDAKGAAAKVLADVNTSIAQATENKNLSQKLIETAEAAAKSATASAEDANKIFQRAQSNRDDAYANILNLAAAAKADPAKTGEAHGAIDRALVVKLSFEHAQNAKAAADKTASEAANNVKLTTDNRAKVEKTLADLGAQQKDADGKLKASEKQFADADAAVKQAEMVVKNTTTNLEGTTAVAKKADEAVVETKKLFGAAEAFEKERAAALEAANKRSAESEKKIRALAFSGPWLILAIEDNSIRAYSADTGKPGPVFGSIPWLTDTNLFALDPTATWKLERQIGDGGEKSPILDRVLALDFSPDGKVLATGGGIPTRGGELKLWNVADGALAREIKDAHSDSVYAIEFSPDGKRLASGAADKLMKVFEVETGKFARSFEGHTHHVLGVSWMRHGRTLASAGGDSAIKLWDFDSGEQKRTIGGVSREITAFQFLDYSPEALAASGDNQLRLIKEDGNNVRTFGGASDYTQTAAITPDGRYVVAGGSDSQFRIWNAQKGDLLKAFSPPARAAKALANNPN